VVGFDSPDQLACIGEALTARQVCIARFVDQVNDLCPQLERCRLDPRMWEQPA
jgi:hypothetical protein